MHIIVIVSFGLLQTAYQCQKYRITIMFTSLIIMLKWRKCVYVRTCQHFPFSL